MSGHLTNEGAGTFTWWSQKRFRPVRGTRGTYRGQSPHGVSRLRSSHVFLSAGGSEGSLIRGSTAASAATQRAWGAFEESYAGLSDAQLMKPGVTGDWSVRDILAHVTTWEEEALTHLPLILEGGTPERYSVRYGGIDAFNARMTEQKADLSLAAVRRQLDETHRRLVDFVRRTPEDQLAARARFRRRLR